MSVYKKGWRAEKKMEKGRDVRERDEGMTSYFQLFWCLCQRSSDTHYLLSPVGGSIYNCTSALLVVCVCVCVCVSVHAGVGDNHRAMESNLSLCIYFKAK